MPDVPAFLARSLTKRFGDVLALDGLDLSVARGEVFGYLGPNGAGKTTTIRLALGALHPSSGSVELLGAPAGDVPTRRRLGYLPADLRLDPRARGQDVLEFFGALHGGLDRRRADELCQRFGLDPGRRIGELSTGNRRKVAVVQAFVHRPELLVLDEPTSGLDPLLQHEFRQLVREAAASGAAVFLSSHVLEEVDVLADRVGILRRGRLVDVAGVDELRARARQRFSLYVDGPADGSVFSGVPGVVTVELGDGVVHLDVEGPVGPALRAAAALDVRRLVSLEADLEQIFLSYYRDRP